MKSTLIVRVMTGAVVATSAFLSTSYLLGQATPPATAPASQAAPVVLARINGQEIDANKFNDLLRVVAGMRMLEQVIDLMVVEQFCNTSGINTNSPDFEKNIQAEYDRALAGIVGNDGVTLTQDQRKMALNQIIQQRGITPVEFQMGLRRGACLRALAQGKVTITDKDITTEYNSRYGERLSGHIFVVTDRETSGKIRAAIDKGDDLNTVVQTYGARPFLLPMSVDIPVPATSPAAPTPTVSIFQKIKDLSGKVAEKQFVGPIAQEEANKPTSYVLFYVEKKETDKRTANPLNAELTAKLRAELQDAGEVNWGNGQLQRLRAAANIQITDPILSQMYADRIKQIKEAQDRAATQSAPASAPATMK